MLFIFFYSQEEIGIDHRHCFSTAKLFQKECSRGRAISDSMAQECVGGVYIVEEKECYHRGPGHRGEIDVTFDL